MLISVNRSGRLLLALAVLLLLAACGPGEETPVTLPNLEQTEAVPETVASPTATMPEPAAETATEAPSPEPENTPAPQIPDGDFRVWTKVAEGFAQPLFVSHAGDGSNRLFVLEQAGRIWVIDEGEVLGEPFLDIRGRVNSGSNEQGLLGLAFHPHFAENGVFYLNYTDSSPATVIARFSLSEEPNQADPLSEAILLRIPQPYSNHNGGHIEFGPDGYLYIAMGDGGSGGDPQNNGQNPETLLGTLLRIDVDGGEPYAIPADNPFVNGGGAPEVWHTGLRNPWRFSFDTATGDLYMADVGQNQWEEINYLPSGVPGGVNFGWNYFEGNHSYEGTPPGNLSLYPPVTEYSHGTGRCSVTGGVVYRGSKLPELWGVYFYGDFCSGEVFALVQEEEGLWETEAVYNLPVLITSFGLDEQGEIYLVDRSGALYNLR